ncbi:MAG: hypothetical protein J7623_27990 [Chitinophaga sp.]|uniref:hypothetical protein n=1 Tax=Chitinophaga sp. TaxID=1869181 RepID=UPI001B11ECB6|nr:hypothetical protein [Chitinophaga sp.]MBO9732516.1 hypothetical protein [Chitinophaga sp.]
MKYRWIIALILISAGNAMAQMKAPEEWVNYETVMGVRNHLRQYDYSVALVHATEPTNVLWPGEQPRYTIQVVNQLNGPLVAEGNIELISYGTKGRPGDIWLPEMEKFATIHTYPVKVNIAPKGYVNLDSSPEIPARFGGYALVLDLGKHGRRFITSLVRTFKANPERIQYPKQSLDDMGPDFLQRVGVQAIRMGVDYTPVTAPDYAEKMAAIDRKLAEYNRRNITVLLMFGAGTGPQPLDRPRSFLDTAGVMKKTKLDYVWLPSSDGDFKTFVQRLCEKHGWPRGPVTAVSLWNEPWEGLSISGWQSDIPRYREIYTVMAAAVLEARKKGADVLVGGGDSNSNAWDKLFADGKMTFLPIFDFCSIHYQGMESPAIYPEWVNRKSPRGRVKIWDTESWVGNTDDRIGLTVATNRAAGYDRSMGIYAGYMYSGGRGSEHYTQQIKTPGGVKVIDRIPATWSPAAALGAVQHLVGERNFNRLLFTNGLPWIMVFDGLRQQADDGTVVISGDIGEAFGPEQVLFRGVRGLGQQLADGYPPLTGGRLVLPAANFQLYDFYGNQLPPVAGRLTVPLNSQGYFLRTNGSKGSFARLLAALDTARIEGYEPVEIIAKDMTAPIAQQPVMMLQLTNILNRPVQGQLRVSLGALQLQFPARVKLAPHETSMVPVKITGGEATVNNTYPLSVHLDAGEDGVAMHRENMHVNVISRLSIHVDGQLDDWKTALPQTVSSSGAASVTLTEAAWYPFKNFDTNANGYANGYVAYDDHYFYFAAKVADSTPHPGTYRFASRPDDDFFYPDTAYAMDMQRALLSKESSVPATDSSALQLPNGNGRTMHYLESSDNTNAFAIDLDLPTPAQVALYLPNLRVPNVTLEVYSGGKQLLQRMVPDLWNGAWEVLQLSGKVRIVLRSRDWWYAVKLGALLFDDAAPGAGPFVKEDLDTRGNWKGVYGKTGHYIVGTTPALPAGVQLHVVEEPVKLPLVWPAGVRHYTYRKNPVTPDNSGLGYSYDNVLLAFNVLPEGKDGMIACPPGTMPRFTGYKCTDYEYAFNQVAPEYGGGTEIWRLLAPGLNRKHFFPRQPKSAGEGPVKGGQLVIRREGNTLITECAIPWAELPDVKAAIDKGQRVKLSFRVNDNGAPGSCMELAKERSVSKRNARAFHPDWKAHWANEVEFGTGR